MELWWWNASSFVIVVHCCVLHICKSVDISWVFLPLTHDFVFCGFFYSRLSLLGFMIGRNLTSTIIMMTSKRNWWWSIIRRWYFAFDLYQLWDIETGRLEYYLSMCYPSSLILKFLSMQFTEIPNVSGILLKRCQTSITSVATFRELLLIACSQTLSCSHWSSLPHVILHLPRTGWPNCLTPEVILLSLSLHPLILCSQGKLQSSNPFPKVSGKTT